MVAGCLILTKLLDVGGAVAADGQAVSIARWQGDVVIILTLVGKINIIVEINASWGTKRRFFNITEMNLIFIKHSAQKAYFEDALLSIFYKSQQTTKIMRI